MTQIGKECHSHCQIYKRMGDCIMPREGVFAEVVTGGHIKVGDEVVMEQVKSDRPFSAAVITLSDKGSAGEREDKSGPMIVEMLKDAGYDIKETILLPDEQKKLLCCHPVQRRQRQRYAGRDRRGIAGWFGWPDAADQR